MPTLLLAALLLAGAPTDTLPVPHAYLNAIAAGTRSRTGAPGPRYWQQRVEYRIRAELQPDQHKVTGQETIHYLNNSPDTLHQIVFNLPQNVFAPGNPRDRAAPVTGGFILDRVVVEGTETTIGPPRGATSAATVAAVRLTRAIAPGGSADVEIAWHFTVPQGTFRMGREDSEVFYLGQWYPQIAVYDDLQGWVRDPYLGDGEFYLEYGDFDVRITAPAGWPVSASGVLQNPREVLTPIEIRRLAALSHDSVTHVLTRDERDAGHATAAGGPDGKLTWHWVARNVRDFAWGSSDEYVWDATVAQYPNDDGSTRTAVINALYRPEAIAWGQAAAYGRRIIEDHSRWYPYPYPQMTLNEGIVGGGMEYPMITIIGRVRTPESFYSVASHELGHMWWPMVVGSNERRYAWMDEGMASFVEDLDTPTLFPDNPGGLGDMNGYLRIAGSDNETESMRAADLYGSFGNRGVASYGKPATVFRALRAILGEETFDRALRTYTRRWAFKHPHPLDFFWTFADVSGRKLDWYFYPWMYTTRVLDQAVTDVRADGDATVVTLEDRGSIPMPILLEVTGKDGKTHRARFGVDVWKDHEATVRVPSTGPAVRVVIDPDQMFPDVDRGNNGWEGGSAR